MKVLTAAVWGWDSKRERGKERGKEKGKEGRGERERKRETGKRERDRKNELAEGERVSFQRSPLQLRSRLRESKRSFLQAP